MRQGQQHRRGRGRNNNNNNHRKPHNPLARSFESNGPDVKVRGTPADIASKYLSLARDAQSSGDPVLAENYYQHAEHYNRIILAYREQQMQQSGENVNGHQPRFGQGYDSEEGDGGEGGEDMGPGHASMGGAEQPGPRLGAESPRAHDNPPRHDEARQQRHHDRQDRYRQDRPERHERFNRPDRHDRQDRPERGERHDRGDRPERPERRPERPFDAPQPEIQAGGEIGGAPRLHDEARPGEPHEIRSPRERAPMAEGGAPRGEGGRPRRERFGPGNEQPEFLRRPVRRPRRDSEAAAPDAAPALDDPPHQD